MIKLIATDMDGTLLDSEKRIPDGLHDVLKRLKERNVKFVAASGRSYVTLYENFRPNSDDMDFICDNGAFVVVDGGVVSMSVIERSRLHAIISTCMEIPDICLVLCGVKGTYHLHYNDEFDAHVSTYYINRKQVANLLDIDDDIFKIAVCDMRGPQNNCYPVLNEIYGGKFSLQISGPLWMDIMNMGINKGDALKRLQEKLGISKAETMAFGDYYNDIELLKNAEYSFVMENANDDMFRYGKYRARSNDENGVIKAIEEYVL